MHRPPPLWRWLPVLPLLLYAGGVVAAMRLQVDEDGLSPHEVVASRATVSEVQRLLPPMMRQSPGSEIRIQWRSDLPDRVHGRSSGRKVLLDRALLQRLDQRLVGNSDGKAPPAALAALIHELAHVHDRALGRLLSSEPRFLDLAGWQVSPARLGLRRPHNAFTDRSPDRYELEDPAEFLSVNLEHFLLDPVYACRRPALHRYFVEHFSWSPVHAPCAGDAVFLHSTGHQWQGAGRNTPLVVIDPARIYAVDYLLAEANAQPMSRWGHSMLRLVICAPGRTPGPACRLDLQHHEVLSFRAFVDDLQLSSWRGLTGSYPSRLFVLPLQQVVDEYTKVELRGLRSVPLALDAQEMAALLERASQLHWSYDSRYAFISNNCAVETYRLLHDAVPRLAPMRLGSITPTGLLQRLQRRGIADGSVLDDREEALRLGYRFDAMSARYQVMFEIARQRLGLPSMAVEEWIELAPARRAIWIGEADLRASAALLVLEQAALRRQEVLARDELKRRLLGRGTEVERMPNTLAALERLLALEGVLSRPALMLQGGYGLPQRSERESLQAEAAARVAAMAEQSASLRAEGRRALMAQRRIELQATETNLQTLGERLRMLNREQGGVQLR